MLETVKVVTEATRYPLAFTTVCQATDNYDTFITAILARSYVFKIHSITQNDCIYSKEIERDIIAIIYTGFELQC